MFSIVLVGKNFRRVGVRLRRVGSLPVASALSRTRGEKTEWELASFWRKNRYSANVIVLWLNIDLELSTNLRRYLYVVVAVYREMSGLKRASLFPRRFCLPARMKDQKEKGTNSDWLLIGNPTRRQTFLHTKITRRCREMLDENRTKRIVRKLICI